MHGGSIGAKPPDGVLEASSEFIPGRKSDEPTRKRLAVRREILIRSCLLSLQPARSAVPNYAVAVIPCDICLLLAAST